jgi:thiamine transporter
MEDNTQNFWQKLGVFLKKYAWIFAIFSALLAIVLTFLPVLTYEIRESIYDLISGERISKTDYTYTVNLIDYFTKGFKLNFTFYITLGFLIVGIALTFASKFKKELLTAGSIFYLLVMCMFVLAKEFFQAEENAVMDYAKVVGDYDPVTQSMDASLHGVNLSWGSALGIVFSNIAFAFTMVNNTKRTVRDIVEEGVLISLAFVLNFIKIPVGATGGSVNFQMLPLMIIALRHGPQHGFIAGGIIYGLLTCLTDGYGFACYPFDYLIGFGSVAVMGFFRTFIFSKEQQTYNLKGLLFIFLAGLLATLVRYIGSNVSSIVVYGLDFKAALIYNSFYIPLSGLISIVALMAMYGPLIKVNKSYPVKKEEVEE